MEYLPFLKGSKDNEQGLRQSLNDISNLSRILEILYNTHNNYEKQIDFFRIIYLIYESIIGTNEKIQNEKQLFNRFKNRFGRDPQEEFLNDILGRLIYFKYITHSSGGYSVSNAGIRMFSVLFNFVSNMFTYHQKENSIEKIMFLTELAGLEFQIHDELNIDNSIEFIHLVHSLKTLTDEIKLNLLEYVNQNNALDNISKLQELIEKTIGMIKAYIDSEKITEKIDDFRLKINDIEDIIQDATLVSVEGLGEVIKALQASTSQVVYSSIPIDLFYNNLTTQIKTEFLKSESSLQSAYDIAVSMDSQEPVMYAPVKIFGALSNEDFWRVVDKIDNNEDLGFYSRKSSLEFDIDIDSNKPQFLDVDEIKEIEKFNSFINKNKYEKTFEKIYDKALFYQKEEKTIYEWIDIMCEDINEQYFFAIVFLDFIHYLNKFGILNMDTNNVSNFIRKDKNWRFIKVSGYPLFTGEELVKFPQKEIIQEYDYSKYKKDL